MRKPLIALAATGALGLAAAPANAATVTISLKDNVFAPKSKTIKKGDTVKFVWRGKAAHNVVGPGFKSKIQTKGTFTRKFSKAGKVKILCTLHGGMGFTLTVK